ncbi:MAG: MFS transporter, partial [Candidatus Neomarinimicrobiota bacterium]
QKTFKIDIRENRNFTWFLVSRLLIFMDFTTIQQFALNFLRDVTGVSNPAEATARFSILAVAGMLAIVYPAGFLSDRIGRKPIAIGAGLLGAAGIAIIFFAHDYGAILVAAGVIGVAIGAFNSTNWALATDLVVKGEEARYLGLANVATAGGAALARLIGPVIDFLMLIRQALVTRSCSEPASSTSWSVQLCLPESSDGVSLRRAAALSAPSPPASRQPRIVLSGPTSTGG